MVPDANSVTVVDMAKRAEYAQYSQKESDLSDENVENLPVFAAPGDGKLTREIIEAYHQDSSCVYTEPESCIGFRFALKDATTENGGMHCIPGPLKGPLKARNYRVGEDRSKTEVLNSDPWPEHHEIVAEARAGTLVIFDGRSSRMSGPNFSDKSCLAYTLHVIDRNCRYPEENWLQRAVDLPLRGLSPNH